MTERPANLPDFAHPPITEVVVGVQFNSISRFATAHVGRLWEEFRDEFPNTEEHPPVMPTFETFGQTSPLLSGIGLGLPGIFTMQRSFFVNSDKTQILQIQKDRFLHNWRKVGDGDGYPRFERILNSFRMGLGRFTAFVDTWSLGTFEPNQCEVTYINQIPTLPGEDSYVALSRIFDGAIGHAAISELGAPQDARLLLRYVIHDPDLVPAGRLIINAEPAKRTSGEDIIQLTVTARGVPVPADTSGVLKFLENGRVHIVRGFTAVTAPAMHAVWGRTQ